MTFIDDILLPYQRDFIKLANKNRHSIFVASRQIGKSFTAAFLCVYSSVIEGENWTLISGGQRQSAEIFKKCVKLSQYFKEFMVGTKLRFDFRHNQSEIKFNNGSSIMCVPNNPETLRGRTSSVLIDEFAFCDNSKELYQAVIPFTTRGGRIVILSSAGGQSGTFYELWTGENDYAKFSVTLPQAIDQGLKVDLDSIRSACVDDDIYRQEYLCEFLDKNSELFSFELLRSRTYQDKPIDGEWYLGIDIGRTHDITAISFILKSGGKLYLDHVETLKNKEFSEQFRYISNCISSKVKKVAIDSSGLGMQLGEDLKKKFGGKIFDAKFSHEFKNEIFSTTKKKLGDDVLFLPDDESILNDIHKIKRVVGNSGNISFQASRDDNGHADIATSIALGVYASDRNGSTFIPFSF